MECFQAEKYDFLQRGFIGVWDGTPHASTSNRDGQSREGGELENLDTNSYSVEAWNGVGAPPVDNVLIRYGLMDGGYYQRTKAASRVLELQGSINVGADKTLNTLHLNRKTFFDALKVDRVDQPQEFWLRYSGTTTPMWIKGVYEGGQEMHYSAKAGFTEKMGVKFLCPDPYFYEDGEQANSLGYTQTVANAAYILQRGTNGNWQALGTGLIGNPLCMAKLSDGGIVVGGSFTTAGGVTVNRFAKWSGSRR